ncbi:MAG: hypothetical protein FWD61_19840, partial [Phycisphaerales bacterium]|nr:hypothetical protein [Phycisphaerales bacterium]
MIDNVTSYNAATGGNVVNQVQNVYNGLGQLITQYQEHNGPVTSATLKVQYAYDTLSYGSRLTSMTYPDGTVQTYSYGASGSLNDTISRLTYLMQSGTTVESYVYLGYSTVVMRLHPEDGVDLTYIKVGNVPNGDAGDKYTGLDRFGRVIDQRWI